MNVVRTSDDGRVTRMDGSSAAPDADPSLRGAPARTGWCGPLRHPSHPASVGLAWRPVGALRRHRRAHGLDDAVVFAMMSVNAISLSMPWCGPRANLMRHKSELCWTLPHPCKHGVCGGNTLQGVGSGVRVLLAEVAVRHLMSVSHFCRDFSEIAPGPTARRNRLGPHLAGHCSAVVRASRCSRADSPRAPRRACHPAPSGEG